MAEDIKLSKAEIEELRSLIRLLKEEMSEVEFQNLLKSGPASKKMLKDLRMEASEFTSDISGVVESFGRLINEIKGTKSGVNQVVSAMKGIHKIGEDIQYAQKGIISLNEKDLAKLQEKMAMKKVDLENADKILKAEQKDLENAESRNKIEQENIKNRLELIKNIEKEFGLSKQLRKEKRELEKQDEKAKKYSKEIEESLKKVISDQKDIEGILNQQDGHYNTLTATLAKLKRQLEDQNKLLGLGGAAVGSLNTALGSLGFGRLASALGISEAQNEMDSFAKKIVQDREEQLILEKEISDEIEARAKGEGKLSPEVLAEKENQLNNLKAQNAQYTGINGQFAVLKKGISSMGASLKKNLTDPLVIATFFVTQFFDALKKADKATGELARQFGTSYDAASNIRQELNDIANSTGNVNITTEKLQKSLMAVNAAFGANAKLSEEELVTFTRLTEEAGYTADELMGIYKISKVTGKSLDDNTKEILGTAAAFNGINKLAINEKEALKEVNKTSNAIKLSLGGNVTELTKAVLQAKQFGINLEQADKIAEGLLNFESSITSELEAELLTGKSLNFERARLLALNNDIAGAAAEVLKQVKSSAEFTNMNRLQQEAIAKSVGMTRDELANSLVEREALAKLDVEGAKTAQEAYETLKKQGLSEQEIAERLGNTKLEQQLRSQSVQERFNATIEKLKEVFISMADPILEIANGLTPAFTVLGYIASILGKILKFFTSIGDGIIPKIIGGLITIRLLTGSIGKGLLSGLVAPFKIAGQGLAMFLPKIGALGKLKDKLGKLSAPTPTSTSGGGMGDGGASEAKNSKNIVSKLFDGIKNIIGSIKDVFHSLIKFVKDIGKDLLKTISELIKGVGGVLQSIIKVISNIGRDLFSALKGIISGIGDVLSKGVDIVINLANKLAGGAMKVLNTVMSGLSQASKSLPTILGNLGKAVGSFFSGMTTGLVAFAQAMAAPTPIGVPVGLIIVGMALGLATAARIAAPAIAALGPMFEGLAKVVTAMAPAIEAVGKVIKNVFEGIGLVIESIGKSISTVVTSIADSIVKLSDIDAANLFAVAGGIAALGVSLAAFGAGGLFAGLGSALGKLFDGDPIEKLNRFANIDSSKILTLADAITKLGESFANFNNTISNIGDVTPIVVTADKIIELHSSLKDKNIIEETITSLTAGIDTLFNKSFSLVQSVFNESPSTIAPTATEEAPSLGKYAKNNLQNNDSTNTSNDTSLDMLSAIEVLKSIDMGIKNLNTKDGNITITLDKDVIGSKVTPVVNTFNNKTKSGVQF